MAGGVGKWRFTPLTPHQLEVQFGSLFRSHVGSQFGLGRGQQGVSKGQQGPAKGQQGVSKGQQGSATGQQGISKGFGMVGTWLLMHKAQVPQKIIWNFWGAKGNPRHPLAYGLQACSAPVFAWDA